MFLNIDKNLLSSSLITSTFSFVIFSIFITITVIYLIIPKQYTKNINNIVDNVEKYYLSNEQLVTLVNSDTFRNAKQFANTQKELKDPNKKNMAETLYGKQIILAVTCIVGVPLAVFLILEFVLKVRLNINFQELGLIVGINIVLLLLFQMLFIYFTLNEYKLIKISNMLKLLIGIQSNE